MAAGTHFKGIVDSINGFSVNGTTVIDANGKIIESAGISLADGDSFDDTNGNEMLEFQVVASAVNHIGFANAATGNNPVIIAEGEADTGMTFENSEGEEMLILDSVASSVNQVVISSAAAAAAPGVKVTGNDTNIGLAFGSKGTGDYDFDGGVNQGGLVTSTGLAALMAPLGAQQALSGAGAITVTEYHTQWTTTAADAGTLADGAQKYQLKKITMVVDGGDGTLTPANTTGGYTTITFADVGDVAELIWDGTGWAPAATYNIATGDAGPALA